MAGLLAGLFMAVRGGLLSTEQCVLWLACMAPVFLAGFMEDLFKKVEATWRLMAAFFAAAIAFFLLDGRLRPPGTSLLANEAFYPVLCFAFTLFAAGGVTHAFNIIDGLNGLLGGTALVGAVALAWMSHQVGDGELFAFSASLAGGTAGFLIFNFPSGKLFAGDAGDYLIGFLVAEISVQLTERHSEVSPWFPLLLVVYPVTEVLFSAYRRRVLKKRPASQADALHLHSLLYKRVGLWIWGGSPGGKGRVFSNAFAAALLWLLTLLPTVVAVMFYDRKNILIAASLLFVLCYILIYWKIVRFKTARPLIWVKEAWQRYNRSSRKSRFSATK